MPTFNLVNSNTIEQNYHNGLLPQRNQEDSFYQDSSCRSNLEQFKLSSENRRIIRKTDSFTFEKISIEDFNYNTAIQKTIHLWVKELGWSFPTSSIKKVFTKHIFNFVYIWKDSQQKVVAYSVCYFDKNISHVAYVFYDPQLSHSDLPIRLALQVVVDSHSQGLKYCYLGRFSSTIGYYKRNMPGFEYYSNGNWQKS